MFFIKDHLGSVRTVVSETGEVQQTNDYYPFGDLFNTARTAGSNGNRYRFTGKELGDETGLYDFSARYLQTSLGRFTTLDPMAEKYPGVSPYAYCKENPVNRVDSDGRIDWKLTGKGILVTISGIGGIVAGASVVAGSAGLMGGLGAFMITGGYFSTGVGLSLFTIGLMTDPSEKNDEIMKTMPTDLSEIFTKPLDIILENDNNQIENTMSTMSLFYDMITFDLKGLNNVEKVLKSAGLASDVALYSSDLYDAVSENQEGISTEDVEKSQTDDHRNY